MTYLADPDRYDAAKSGAAFRRCGRSGLDLPAISLGLWHNFGDERPLETQRAILRLYRSSPASALARAGRDLRHLSCPALILWGDGDPYIASKYADGYGQVLPASEVRHLQSAGHWPWIDRPGVVDDVAAFVRGRP